MDDRTDPTPAADEPEDDETLAEALAETLRHAMDVANDWNPPAEP